MVDMDGTCSKFLGFLWKIDCGEPSCPTNKNYENNSPSNLEMFLTHMARPRDDGNTFSAGFAFGASGGGVTEGKSYVLSVDTSHNYATQKSTTSGASTGAGVSGGIVMTYTNATNVQDLAGPSDSYGATVASLGGLSIDYISFVPASNPDKKCWGFSVTVSLGGELEFHRAQNFTESSESWNPFLKLSDLFS